MPHAPLTLNWRVALASLALLTILACGGGGGGGTPEPPPSDITGITIEARAGDRAVDQNNLQAGSVYTMRMWGRNGSGNVVTVAATDWSTNAPASIATITPTGELTVTGVTSTVYNITARGEGQVRTFSFRTRAAGFGLGGRVRNTESQGVPGVIVRTYTNSGTVLGTAVTGSDGTFTVVSTANAARFFVDASPVSNRYYNQFGYQSGEYGPACPQYRPVAPAQSSGSVTNLPTNPVLYRNSAGNPPPPPPDCGF